MRKRPLGCLFEVVETLVLTLIIFLVIQNFVAQPYRIEQQSMEQTLEPGQYVLIDKLSPHWADYGRGDIIVFWPPEGARDVPFIKRVIGLPGDRIDIHDGAVFVNGVQLDEPYVFEGPTEAAASGESVVVPPDSFYALGDHRSDSTDSRSFGFIPRADIIGRAIIRYWPIGTFRILQTPTYPGVSVGRPAERGSGVVPAELHRAAWLRPALRPV
ncbi:MAG: signal peptidase I [Candidatus Limnocylindrales bacterium]